MDVSLTQHETTIDHICQLSRKFPACGMENSQRAHTITMDYKNTNGRKYTPSWDPPPYYPVCRCTCAWCLAMDGRSGFWSRGLLPPEILLGWWTFTDGRDSGTARSNSRAPGRGSQSLPWRSWRSWHSDSAGPCAAIIAEADWPSCARKLDIAAQVDDPGRRLDPSIARSASGIAAAEHAFDSGSLYYPDAGKPTSGELLARGRADYGRLQLLSLARKALAWVSEHWQQAYLLGKTRVLLLTRNRRVISIGRCKH